VSPTQFRRQGLRYGVRHARHGRLHHRPARRNGQHRRFRRNQEGLAVTGPVGTVGALAQVGLRGADPGDKLGSTFANFARE